MTAKPAKKSDFVLLALAGLALLGLIGFTAVYEPGPVKDCRAIEAEFERATEDGDTVAQNHWLMEHRKAYCRGATT